MAGRVSNRAWGGKTPRIARRAVLGGLAGAAAFLAGRPAAAALPVLLRPDGDLIGKLSWYVTDDSQTLLEVAQSQDLGILEISAANPGIDPWVPGQGRPVLLPTAHLLPDAKRQGIVINKAELRLYLYRDDGEIETHAIGVGRDGYDTPLGGTTIVRKQADPSWRPTAGTRADHPDLPAVVGPGPDNPLGSHALYLGWPTYLIHGTNAPFGVGRRASRGCIRMYPQTIAHLYDTLPTGTPVAVVDQPIKLGHAHGELYVEIHPDSDQLDQLEATYRFSPRPAEAARKMLQESAGADLHRIDWDVVEAEMTARRGVPVQVTRPAAWTAEPRSATKKGFGGLY